MSATAVNPAYRVEHVASTPAGWHVRTKMEATHVLRIAFPPGRRRKGAGKVVEILHPVNENPCALNTDAETRAQFQRSREEMGHRYSSEIAELRRDLQIERDPEKKRKIRSLIAKFGGKSFGMYRRGNPGDATEKAEHLYREFHGTDPREIVEMQESDAARHTFTALGDLSQLVIHAPAGTIKIDFSHSDAVKVASAPGGRQLYLLGGNQNIDSALEQFGSDPRKDFVELGEGKQITYSARKKFDDFRLVDYYHNLGEETGERPILFYDRMKKRIFFVGGRYRVEAPGIIN